MDRKITLPGSIDETRAFLASITNLKKENLVRTLRLTRGNRQFETSNCIFRWANYSFSGSKKIDFLLWVLARNIQTM